MPATVYQERTHYLQTFFWFDSRSLVHQHFSHHSDDTSIHRLALAVVSCHWREKPRKDSCKILFLKIQMAPTHAATDERCSSPHVPCRSWRNHIQNDSVSLATHRSVMKTWPVLLTVWWQSLKNKNRPPTSTYGTSAHSARAMWRPIPSKKEILANAGLPTSPGSPLHTLPFHFSRNLSNTPPNYENKKNLPPLQTTHPLQSRKRYLQSPLKRKFTVIPMNQDA